MTKEQRIACQRQDNEAVAAAELIAERGLDGKHGNWGQVLRFASE